MSEVTLYLTTRRRGTHWGLARCAWPSSQTRAPSSENPNPNPQIREPKPELPNLKTQTRNPWSPLNLYPQPSSLLPHSACRIHHAKSSFPMGTCRRAAGARAGV